MQNIKHIEEIAANAWRPAIEQHLDGWRLRYDHNITQRANSVLPLHHHGEYNLDEKIDMVEEFYARYECPPRFQITDVVEPKGLADELVSRGYLPTIPTEVQVAGIVEVIHHISPDQSQQIDIASEFSEKWMDFFARASGKKAQIIDVRKGILKRIGPERAFARLKIDGQTAACGLGVYERSWVGIFSMLTDNNFRRRGAAKQVLRVLAEWGKEQGADKIYLQVESDNPPALALYEGAGFTKNHAYYYLARGKAEW